MRTPLLQNRMLFGLAFAALVASVGTADAGHGRIAGYRIGGEQSAGVPAVAQSARCRECRWGHVARSCAALRASRLAPHG